ncbi:MAG: two component signal transduction system histidine kinase [Algoriphagus marincola HL-49]|uniref:Two component signal transduction system histidine kinase n=1 Tax=Algoriphagus marincola HL-49 TaxID=1305737 RepID=A0A0P8ADA1_9BACT|nr:MAG: two component signal transduction system histidine kinase [Algoriphagus marincola HL-49]
MDVIISFLQDSNYNGLGFSIISILFYLSIYHFVLYLKNKDKFYLFYSTYAFTNVLILVPIPYNVFLQDIFLAFPEFFIQLDSPLKFASYILFSYFVIEVLHLKNHLPRFVRFFNYFTLSGVGIYLVLGALEFFKPELNLLQTFFYFIFLPIYFFVMIYGSILIIRIDEKVKGYILTGSLFLGVGAILSAILTVGQPAEVIDQNFYVYYIGVLVENLLFTYALAIKQREVYKDKLKFQEELVLKLKENEELREKLNQRLQSELDLKERQIVTLAADAESERMARVKANYEREITELHLRSLRSQMNPHFIFNALNSIKVFLIENDKDRAILYLNRFSKLIRLVLESSRKTKISLGEELEIAQLYTTLESIRFEDGIELKMEIGEDVRLNQIEVPPLLLQPFFENAIWHGLMNKAGEKWVKVVLKKQEDGHILSIRDNGIGRKASQEINSKRTMKKESIGMSLSKDRLALFNKNESVNYHFEIVDYSLPEDSGTEIIFWL